MNVVHHVRPVLGVLPEPLVELTAKPAGDVRDDSVERLPTLLVEVEVVVDQRPEQPPGLRSTVGVRVTDGRRRRIPLARRPVLEPGDRVTERRDAEPEYRRADRGVGHLVEPPLLEPAVDPDVARVGHDAAGGDTGEAPPATRDRRRLAVRLVAGPQ